MLAHDKRSLLDPTKPSSMIIALFVGIILSFIVFASVGPGLVVGFLSTALFMFVIQPVVNKILLGYWFWADDAPQQVQTA